MGAAILDQESLPVDIQDGGFRWRGPHGGQPSWIDHVGCIHFRWIELLPWGAAILVYLTSPMGAAILIPFTSGGLNHFRLPWEAAILVYLTSPMGAAILDRPS